MKLISRKVAGLAAVLGAVLAVAAFSVVGATGGVYDYSALIVPGTLLTDLALMVTAGITIAIGARFAFKGARFALKAVGLIR